MSSKTAAYKAGRFVRNLPSHIEKGSSSAATKIINLVKNKNKFLDVADNKSFKARKKELLLRLQLAKIQNQNRGRFGPNVGRLAYRPRPTFEPWKDGDKAAVQLENELSFSGNQNVSSMGDREALRMPSEINFFAGFQDVAHSRNVARETLVFAHVNHNSAVDSVSREAAQFSNLLNLNRKKKRR